MLHRAPNNKKTGFTIIEVMIVLAIAGIIMLLVFLAIPALQRNNRNTQLRSDVANVLGYVSEYTSNHNGGLPGAVVIDPVGSGVVMMGATIGTVEKVGNIRAGTDVELDTATTPSTTTIVLLTNNQCNGPNAAPGGGSRSIVATYHVETAGGTTVQCQAS